MRDVTLNCRSAALLLCVTALFSASLCMAADAYPAKAVRLIVPFAPGGAGDIVMRVTAQQVSEQLGKPFVVENRPGAGAAIGLEAAARSAPDGYTLTLIDTSATILPGLFKSLPFDVARDFAPISQITQFPNVLVITPSLNVNTLKAFVALARANPGKYNYGSAGSGSSNHLLAALFCKMAKVELAHVPFKGAADAMTGLLSGAVQMQITAMPSVIAQVNAGKVRALAVTTANRKRATLMPDVPSMSEAGIPGMATYAWQGLGAPAGTPKEIVNKLHTAVKKAIAESTVRDKLGAQLGAELVGSSPAEFSTLIRNELRRWAEVITTAGITPE